MNEFTNNPIQILKCHVMHQISTNIKLKRKKTDYFHSNNQYYRQLSVDAIASKRKHKFILWFKIQIKICFRQIGMNSNERNLKLKYL